MPQTEMFSFSLEIGIGYVFSKTVSLQKNVFFLNIYLIMSQKSSYLGLNNLFFS